MRTLFLQITIMAISFSSCTSIKSFNVINKSDNQSVLEVSSPTPKIMDSKWQPAIFKGLRIGLDLRSDAIKNLGKPKSTAFSDQNDLPINSDPKNVEILDKYENIDFYGETVIISSRKNNIILEVVIYPKNLSIDEAIKFFGDDYKRTLYDFIECPGDAGSSRIYESKNGELKYIEYRLKGIAVQIDNSEKQVEAISFVSQPIGLTSADCSKKLFEKSE